MTEQRVRDLQMSRFTQHWRKTSDYLPLAPHRPARSLWQKWQRLLWKALHRRR